MWRRGGEHLHVAQRWRASSCGTEVACIFMWHRGGVHLHVAQRWRASSCGTEVAGIFMWPTVHVAVVRQETAYTANLITAKLWKIKIKYFGVGGYVFPGLKVFVNEALNLLDYFTNLIENENLIIKFGKGKSLYRISHS